MEVGDEKVFCYPEYPNNTCWFPQPTTQTLAFDIAMFSTSVFTAVLNLFIIISVSHFRQLHTPTNILLLSLAVSDFLVGLLVMPFQTRIMNHCWLFDDLWCSVFRFLSLIIFSASVGNMVLISVDRYLAICDPLHYTTRVTVNRAKVSVCLLWLFSVAYNSYYFLLHLIQLFFTPYCLGSCVSLLNNVGSYIQIVLDFTVPVSIIIVLYVTVFAVAVSQARAMRSHVTAVTKQISVTKTAKKSELKAARTLGVLVVVFLICLLPTYFVAFAGKSMSSASVHLTQFLYFFNSCLNPVIYALFYSWFRKAVKLTVTLQILQPGSSEANVL